jgi:hypothetical protein
VTDVISTHSYIKTSCIQVFLYTNVDNLFKEAALALKESSHEDPLYVIVESHAQKEALLKQIYAQNGFTNFTSIDTLSNTLTCLLKKYSLKKEVKIHDRISLTLAIYELILKKDPATFCFNIDEALLSDLDSVFIVAKELASELFQILEIASDSDDEKACGLKQSIKILYPEILFQDEALKLCTPYFDKLVFVGFTYLPISYVHLLNKSRAKLYLLVPSLAFLGDVLSPKQRLKSLRQNAKRLDKSFNFEEHPLLENLSAQEKQFYNEIAQFDQVYPEDDLLIEPKTALEKIQYSLKTGFYEKQREIDSSIDYITANSPYKQSCVFIEKIQKLHTHDPDLINKQILIIGDRGLIGPVLNALGQNFEKRLGFGVCDKPNLVWNIIKDVVNQDSNSQTQNFFIAHLNQMLYFYEDSGSQNSCLNCLNFIKSSHKNNLAFSLHATAFLKAVKNSILRSDLFNYHDHEMVYEIPFLEADLRENLEETISFFDDYISLIAVLNSYKEKLLSIQEWALEISKLLKISVFKKNFMFDFNQLIFAIFKNSPSTHVKLSFRALNSLFASCFFDKKSEINNIISIEDLKYSSSQQFDYVFVLGEEVFDEKHKMYFASKFSNFNKQLLILHQAKKGFIRISSFDVSKTVCDFDKHLLSILPIKETTYSFYKNYLVNQVEQKQFIHPEIIYSLAINRVNKSLLSVDIKHLERFLKNFEEATKKDFLKIRQYEVGLDASIFERNLLLWKLQSMLCKKQISTQMAFLDSFRELVISNEEKKFLRSLLVDIKDHLTGYEILPHLIIDNLCLVGETNTNIEAKFKGSLDKIQLYELFKFLF